MRITMLAAMVPPEPTDLWAFWLLAGLWMGILSAAWFMVRWLLDGDQGPRGL